MNLDEDDAFSMKWNFRDDPVSKFKLEEEI